MSFANTFTLTANTSSNSLFRTWVNAISQQLQATPLVHTADSGQIDTATVATASPLQGVSQGYEMYRFDDVLQATAPIFVKIEYGSNNQTSGPGFWLSFGTGSDGSGNLTGFNPGRIAVYGQQAAAAQTARISADVNRLSFFFPGSGSTATYYFNIERTHSPLGTDTAEGLLVLYRLGTINRQVLWTPTAYGADESSYGLLMPTGNTGQSGSDTTLYPIFLNKGVFLNPCMNALGYFEDNVPAGIPLDITFYGSTRTYYPIGVSAFSGTCDQRATASRTSLMMRWEP